MVDFKYFPNSSITGKKPFVIQRRCRRTIDRHCQSQLSSDQSNDRKGINLRGSNKQYWVCFIGVILIYPFYYGLVNKNDKEEELNPPNPAKTLPSSGSHLRRFKKAAICADSAICAKIGKSILNQNGSAVDAAIATMFCNGIFAMQSTGLGGGFLMTIYIKEHNKVYALNAREAAPLTARPELYKDDPMKSRKGPLAVAVPGELRGYQAAHERFGKLKWARLVEPSIELCDKGYQMSKHQYHSLQKAELLRDVNFREWFYEADGSFKKAGSIIFPQKLCKSLKTIAENGGHDLYNGSLSKIFLEDLENLGVKITREDLENYQAHWMDPIAVRLRNNKKLFSFPPPGSGALLGFIINILDGYMFKPSDIEGSENIVKTYHKIIESFKYAYAKRTELGDTTFVDISNLLHNLTSYQYAEYVRKLIKDDNTNKDPKDYGSDFYTRDDHGTAHISVIAENGDAVSATSSINLFFGAGLTSEQTGIILNSVMDDFSFPYFQNYFNLPGSPNNALQPGKRPLSSMSPTVVVDKNNDVNLVIGASGGTKITTAVALVIMRTIWFGQDIKQAVDAPRIHHQLIPMQVEYEYGTLQSVIEGLESFGHKTSRYRDVGSIICALMKTSDHIYANADYRKGGDVYGI